MRPINLTSNLFKMKRLILIFTILGPFLGCTDDNDFEISYQQESLRDDWLFWMKEHKDLAFNFFLYVPENQESSGEDYPLIVFMHGDDGYRYYSSDPKWKDFGGPLTPLLEEPLVLAEDNREMLNPLVRNAFVIEPQIARIDDSYGNPLGYWNPHIINDLIDYMIENYPIDASRIYITGLSFGGWGTWYYAKKYPERVTAMIPVCCGFGGTEEIENLRGIPAWLFYSFDDGISVIPGSTNVREFSRLVQVKDIMAGYPHKDNIRNQAAETHCTISIEDQRLGNWQEGVIPPTGWFTYTLYKDGGHNAWDRTYSNDDVYNWLFAQK